MENEYFESYVQISLYTILIKSEYTVDSNFNNQNHQIHLENITIYKDLSLFFETLRIGN